MYIYVYICWKIRTQRKLKNKHTEMMFGEQMVHCVTSIKHFQMPGHNFNTHAKFTIIEEVYNKSLSKLKIRSLLEHREDFWILKLQTLSPQGLNISLNYPQDTTGSIW